MNFLSSADESIEFFRALERLGNRGPLLEVPIRLVGSEGKLEAYWKADLTRDQFITAYDLRDPP